MKGIFTLFLGIWVIGSVAQELPSQKVSTQIDEVTVFLEGAQINREGTVHVKPGESVLRFTGLSPHIQGNSIQVQAGDAVMILSANHKQNVFDTLQRKAEFEDLQKKLEVVNDKISMERTYLDILSEKLAFLQQNRDIGGKDQAVSATALKAASDYYGSSLTELKMEELKRKGSLKKLEADKQALEDQSRAYFGNNEEATGEIEVKVKSDKATSAKVSLQYLVSAAGWYPSYDLRAEDVNEPIALTYKANVYQNTGIDWKDVQLRFSSANPNITGTAPQLETYYLDYNLLPPSYQGTIRNVSGRVSDENGEPLPGANVIIEGSSIGTMTNFDGFYTLSIPSPNSVLRFSYIGMKSVSIPVSQSVQNVQLQTDVQALEEVVTVGYGEKRDVSRALQGKVAGVPIAQEAENTLPVETMRNRTTVDFSIGIPYSVTSDNQSYAVDMVTYQVPATYTYFSVPKAEEAAYLLAGISDWEQYDLLEGEANIFFDNTLVGRTVLDVRRVTDALELSLGSDKNVSIQREKDVIKGKRQFIGNKREEVRRWKTTVKNNKDKAITLRVEDQVPLSRKEEIEVEVGNTSGGELESATGKITWNLTLNPGESRELLLEYTVKYPKGRVLMVE